MKIFQSRYYLSRAIGGAFAHGMRNAEGILFRNWSPYLCDDLGRIVFIDRPQHDDDERNARVIGVPVWAHYDKRNPDRLVIREAFFQALDGIPAVCNTFTHGTHWRTYFRPIGKNATPEFQQSASVFAVCSSVDGRFYNLTTKQSGLLQLLADGCPWPKIAAELQCEEQAARSRFDYLKRRLSLSSADLISWADWHFNLDGLLFDSRQWTGISGTKMVNEWSRRHDE